MFSWSQGPKPGEHIISNIGRECAVHRLVLPLSCIFVGSSFLTTLLLLVVPPWTPKYASASTSRVNTGLLHHRGMILVLADSEVQIIPFHFVAALPIPLRGQDCGSYGFTRYQRPGTSDARTTRCHPMQQYERRRPLSEIEK